MKRLNTTDASVYLEEQHGITRTPSTIRKYRCTGEGPRFRKVGRNALYDITALDEWALSILGDEVSSTAEYRSEQPSNVAAFSNWTTDEPAEYFDGDLFDEDEDEDAEGEA